MQTQRFTFFGVLALGLLFVALPVWGQGEQLVNRSTRWGVAYGVSIFGAPDGEPFQVVTGYDSGTTYLSTRGGAIEATPEAIVLNGDGIYQITLEGTFFFDADDPSAPDEASSAFPLLVNGSPEVLCVTPANGSAPRLPDLLKPTPEYDRVASCSVSFTLEVKQGGSDPAVYPVTYPRYTTLQAGLVPNGPLGDTTLFIVRMEATRVGP